MIWPVGGNEKSENFPFIQNIYFLFKNKFVSFWSIGNTFQYDCGSIKRFNICVTYKRSDNACWWVGSYNVKSSVNTYKFQEFPDLGLICYIWQQYHNYVTNDELETCRHCYNNIHSYYLKLQTKCLDDSYQNRSWQHNAWKPER